MIARIIVGLLMITCFITLFASGCTQGEKTKPEGKSIDEMTAKLLAPGADIEKGISDRIPSKDPEEPPDSMDRNTPEPYSGASDVAGYPMPNVVSRAFVAAEKDPLTGKAWGDLRATIQTTKGQIIIKFYQLQFNG